MILKLLAMTKTMLNAIHIEKMMRIQLCFAT